MKKLFFALIAVASLMSVFACFNREGHGGFNFIYADSILGSEVDTACFDSCEDCSVVADSGYYPVADSGYYVVADSCFTDTMFSNDFTPSLNDIRFSGWTEEDWWDNDYIKALRAYLDEFQAGRIEDEELMPYKDKINCQFVVGQIGQFFDGGVFIDIIFLDLPNRVFSSWVYSYVDGETNVITGYEVKSVTIQEELTEISKEEILNDVKEDPNLKLW